MRRRRLAAIALLVGGLFLPAGFLAAGRVQAEKPPQAAPAKPGPQDLEHRLLGTLGKVDPKADASDDGPLSPRQQLVL
ncbi:MAG: hypothetical protein ABI639_06025, partial [Thermoanaerobaculia bacterium]